MIEKNIEFQEVKICTEHTGNEGDPAILLMMGATASMLWWDEEFCEGLAERGFFVIRYDNRDVGNLLLIHEAFRLTRWKIWYTMPLAFWMPTIYRRDIWSGCHWVVCWRKWRR